MKHLKLFENFEPKSMDELRHMEKWIESVWDRLENMDNKKLSFFFKDVEDSCGEMVANIIDHRSSTDNLHYHQSGNTNGIDTVEFIENFENIKSDVEKILETY